MSTKSLVQSFLTTNLLLITLHTILIYIKASEMVFNKFTRNYARSSSRVPRFFQKQKGKMTKTQIAKYKNQKFVICDLFFVAF